MNLRRITASQLEAWMSTITIRLATPADAHELRALATLDSADPIQAPILIAEQDGHLQAARELDTGKTIANPFAHTAHLLQLLSAHADGRKRASHGRFVNRSRGSIATHWAWPARSAARPSRVGGS
jgi:hypothetical protein